MKQKDGWRLEVKQHVKQMDETRNKTRDETTSKTCKRKIKNVPEPTGYICSMWQIVTLAPSEPLHFSKGKKHSRRCHPR
jgi:hypothetical protein